MIQFLRQLGWELFRLFARRRTYIGFGLFLAVEVLFYILEGEIDRSYGNLHRAGCRWVR